MRSTVHVQSYVYVFCAVIYQSFKNIASKLPEHCSYVRKTEDLCCVQHLQRPMFDLVLLECVVRVYKTS